MCHYANALFCYYCHYVRKLTIQTKRHTVLLMCLFRYVASVKHASRYRVRNSEMVMLNGEVGTEASFQCNSLVPECQITNEDRVDIAITYALHFPVLGRKC